MKKKAKNIDFKLAIGSGFDSEFSAKENTDWLRQFVPGAFPELRGYLIECVNEDYPIRIWEQANSDKPANFLDTMYECIYEDQV